MNPIKGLIHVTGEPDTGKTTFALECGFRPEEICFFDDDLKTQAIATMLEENGTPFGAYFNLTKMSLNMREVQFHDLVVKLIDEQPIGKYKALVFDTWSRFENTLHPVIQKNPGRFREFYSTMGAIKGAEMWKASFDYEAVLIDKLMQIAPLVILVTHLKDQNIGSVKTGKQIPDCKKPVVEKSRMRIWTRHNPDGPKPIGLILKRLSRVIVDDNGIRTVNVLPRKLSPCTWKRILEYWENPMDEREGLAEENPNEFELSILDGVLTADQKDVLHINRVEADKPQSYTTERAPSQPLEIPAITSAGWGVTLNDLMDRYGVDAILEANGGTIPGTDEDVMVVAALLEAIHANGG